MHHCHARGCIAPIQMLDLMCETHWHKVPSRIRMLIAASYRAGQDGTAAGRPSEIWQLASQAAIAYVGLLDAHYASRAGIRTLIELGYEQNVIAAWGQRGPEYRKSCERVVAEIKKEIETDAHKTQ